MHWVGRIEDPTVDRQKNACRDDTILYALEEKPGFSARVRSRMVAKLNRAYRSTTRSKKLDMATIIHLIQNSAHCVRWRTMIANPYQHGT